jgi:hypothetical protein
MSFEHTICIDVCIVVCVVVCGVVVCVVVSCVVIVCVAGVGGRVCFILCICEGGRWCDIPMTWQMMVRTYMDIQPPGTNSYLEYEFVPATPTTAVRYPNQLA